MFTGISGSKHSRRTPMTSSGLSVASGATADVTAGWLTESPWVPVKSQISWGDLQRQARLAPRLGAAAEVDDVLGAEGDRHLGGDGGPASHGAHENRAIAELVRLGRLQDVVEHDVTGTRDVALVPLPVVPDVDDLITVVDQILDLAHLGFAKRGLLAHNSLLLLVVRRQSICPHFQHLQREESALDPRRRDLDAELSEDVILADLARLVEGHPLETLGQERGGCLRDGTAPAVKPDVLYDSFLHAEIHADDVAAQGVVLLVADVGVLEAPEVARVLVVVEDELAVKLIVSRSPGSCTHPRSSTARGPREIPAKPPISWGT